MTCNHTFGTIALVPYWINLNPSFLINSDHFWWFEPLCGFDTVIYVGPYIESDTWKSFSQNFITLHSSSLNLAIEEIEIELRNLYTITLRDVSLLWHIIEASSTCRINDVSRIGGASIAVIADTHHLKRPISSLVDYIRNCGYTHLTCTHNQHTPFFASACNIETFSFPYSTFNCVNPSTQANKKDIIYYGNLVSSHHTFRSKIVNLILSRSGLITKERLSFWDWVKALSDGDQCVLTCSLNGSFSFQTLLPLAYGNILITDPICSSNWLGKLLPVLPSCYIYHDSQSCLDIINQLYLKNKISKNTTHANKFVHDILGSCLNNRAMMKKALAGGSLQLGELNDTRTDGEDILYQLLSSLKSEFGLEEVEKLIRVYESIQEYHRLIWSLKIASINVICRKTEFYDVFMRLLHTMLPRVKYSCPEGLDWKIFCN